MVRTSTTRALLAAVTRAAIYAMAAENASAACNGDRIADLVLTNGSIYTVDSQRTTATALAVKEGKIVYVGNNTQEAMSFACEATRVVDLNGKMVLPGFIDAHNHVSDHPETLFWLNLTAYTTIDQYGAALLKFRASDPAMQQLRAVGWNVGLVTQASAATGRSPKELLDEYVRDIPVVALDNPHHEMWVNSKAFELARIDQNSPDPGGGIIARIPRTAGFGEPSGILREFAAQDLVVRALPLPDSTVEQYERAILDWQRLAAERGITSVLVPQPRPSENFYRALQRLDAAGRLTVDYDVAIWADERRGTEQVTEFVRLRSTYSGKKFRIDTVKIFGTGVGTGLVWKQDVLTDTVTALDRAGFRAFVHVIGPEGDYAAMLDAFENMTRRNGRRPDARHTITHVSPRAVGLANRFRELGILADGHPVPWAFDAAAVRWSLSSDYPVREWWPLTRVQLAVRSPEAPRDALARALAGHTIGGAYLSFSEDRTGSIERGKQANLVVLEKDLFTIPTDQISQTKTMMTIADGEIVYRDSSIRIASGPK